MKMDLPKMINALQTTAAIFATLSQVSNDTGRALTELERALPREIEASNG